MPRLLSAAVGDTDGVRADLLGQVIEHLGDPGAVLVVDETGDVKKGSVTVGVHRQDTPTAGRVENSQVAGYLTQAAGSGDALVDRAVYLPTGWADDVDRRAAGGGVRDHAGLGQDHDRAGSGRGGSGGVAGRRRGGRR